MSGSRCRRYVLAVVLTVGVAACSAPAALASTSSGFHRVFAPAVRDGALADVSASGPHAIWAVGGLDRSTIVRGHPVVISYPLIYHFFGRTWRRVRLPGPIRYLDVDLTSVKSFGRHDVWAVGRGERHVLNFHLVHFDGHAWTAVAIPLSVTRGWWDAVDGSSPDDVWAVGEGRLMPGPLVAHWDGTSWHEMPVPTSFPSDGSTLTTAVKVFSPTDVWLLTSYISGCCSELAMVFHYNGTSWSHRLLPDVFGSGYAFQHDIEGTSDASLWTVGSGVGDYENEILVYRWLSGAWQPTVPFPQSAPTERSYDLYSAAVVSATDLWATGGWVNDVTYGAFGSFFLHYDGSSWTRIHQPRGGGVGAITTVPGSPELVAVGSTDSYHPLIEVRATS